VLDFEEDLKNFLIFYVVGVSRETINILKRQKDAHFCTSFRKGLDKEMGMSGLGLRPKWKVS
jgi:hypothetical protein